MLYDLTELDFSDLMCLINVLINVVLTVSMDFGKKWGSLSVSVT